MNTEEDTIVDFRSKEADEDHAVAHASTDWSRMAITALSMVLVAAIAFACLYTVCTFAYGGVVVAVKEAVKIASSVSFP